MTPLPGISYSRWTFVHKYVQPSIPIAPKVPLHIADNGPDDIVSASADACQHIKLTKFRKELSKALIV